MHDRIFFKQHKTKVRSILWKDTPQHIYNISELLFPIYSYW